jgi:hypothetical protein
MTIRPLALALFLVATHALAATHPKSKPAPPAEQTPVENIDVDAMARAKDAAATAAPADAPPSSDSASTASTETPPSDVDAAPKGAAAAAETPPSDIDAAPKDAAAPAATDASSSAASTPAPSPAAKSDVPPLLAPAPDDDERRLAAACESRSTSLLDSAQKADYANATRDFDAKMRTAMPVPKFKQAWESLAQFGTFTARGQSHLTKGDGYIAVTIPLVFEKANLYVQVACGSDGRIAGLYFKPLEIPKS